MRTDKRIFALGFFDGVHLGHQALLKACRALANELDCQAAAITFDKHPQAFFADHPPALINTAEDRQLLLRSYGMGPIYMYPVVREVMTMPWQDFFCQLLEYGAAGFVCGDDFRFGYRGEGTPEKLREACRERSIPCIVVPQQDLEGVRISSTHIRQLLERGDMEGAVKYLGHPHILTGAVVPGQHLGRTLGTPTANLVLPEGVLIPKFGVYACRAKVDGETYLAVTNVGTRPTVNGTNVTVEPWLLDFTGDLYGKKLTLEFYKFLRPERKFPSLEDLRREIQKNAAETREFFEIM